MKATSLAAAVMLPFVFAWAPLAPAQSPPDADLATRAADLHGRLFTLDAHLDTPTVSLVLPGWDFAQRHEWSADLSFCDLPRMREGGLAAAFFAINLEQGPRTPEALLAARNQVLRVLAKARETIVRNSTACEMALSADDGPRIAATGRRAIYLSIENGHAVGRDLSLLGLYHQLGVRMAGITHMKNNDLGDSSTDEKPEWNGLSPLGRDYVRECNRLGIVVDASHVSDAVLREALTLSQTPVILSHSGCRTIHNHPRNVDDDLLRQLAVRGGVIQIVAVARYLADYTPPPELQAAKEQHAAGYSGRELTEFEAAERDRGSLRIYHEFYPVAPATLDDFMRHLVHAIEVAGIDHVGIGSDMDGGGRLADLEDVSAFSKITLTLLQRGYSEADIAKIWGGNTLRVLRAAEAHARSLRNTPAVTAR
jgi:membrane dipeptidase